MENGRKERRGRGGRLSPSSPSLSFSLSESMGEEGGRIFFLSTSYLLSYIYYIYIYIT